MRRPATLSDRCPARADESDAPVVPLSQSDEYCELDESGPIDGCFGFLFDENRTRASICQPKKDRRTTETPASPLPILSSSISLSSSVSAKQRAVIFMEEACFNLTGVPQGRGWEETVHVARRPSHYSLHRYHSIHQYRRNSEQSSFWRRTVSI